MKLLQLQHQFRVSRACISRSSNISIVVSLVKFHEAAVAVDSLTPEEAAIFLTDFGIIPDEAFGCSGGLLTARFGCLYMVLGVTPVATAPKTEESKAGDGFTPQVPGCLL